MIDAEQAVSQLEAINALVQDWIDLPNKDDEALSNLLLELDLAINSMKIEAENQNDHEVVNIYAHFQENLLKFSESSASKKCTELLSAWPIYLAEFITSRSNEEIKNGLKEFLGDDDWPIAYLSSDSSEEASPFEVSIQEGIQDEEFAELPSSANNQVIGNTALSSKQKEFLELIITEVIEIQEKHSSRITALLADNHSDDSKYKIEIETQVEQLERIGSANQMIGLKGVNKYCQQLVRILVHVLETNPDQLHTLQEEIKIWPDMLQAYLYAPNDKEYIQVLLDYLKLDCWPLKITPEELKIIEQAFVFSRIEIEDSDAVSRVREATPDAISLDKPEDVNEELFDSLLQDLPQQTQEFTLAVQRLRTSEFIEQLEISKRLAHTLKGAGNTVGIMGLANLTHHLEDILEALLKAKATPAILLHNCIEKAADCLEEMSEFLHGMGNAPADALSIFQEVLNWANHIDENGIPNDEVVLDEIAAQGDTLIKAEDNESIKPDTDSKKEAGQHNKQQSEQSLRIHTSLIDELLKYAGENIISNAQIQEFIGRSKSFSKQLRLNNNKIKSIVSELEHLLHVRGFSSRFQEQINSSNFDPIEMDQYNELNTYANLLLELAADSSEFVENLDGSLLKLDNLSANQNRVMIENQDTVLRTKMVPVRSIVQRLKRSVKQANKLSNKTTTLAVKGEDVLVDSEILNQLIDPLMHILRNAIDHGIESPEFREKQGKAEAGLVELNFKKEGKMIHICCQDDGRGLDIERIKEKAIEKNLIQEDEEFNKNDAMKLILNHGFSTKENVSQLSGRGVGLDVVFEEVRDLKGSLTIDSKYGNGVQVEIVIPTSFHSTQAFLVTCANNTLALSERGVEEILHPGAGKIIENEGKQYFDYKQKRYPIFDLQKLLYGDQVNDAAEMSQVVFIIQDEFHKHHAILIDKIIDSREIVIKPFSKFIPKMTGLLGTTILGNGNVTSVLDLLDIVNTQHLNIVNVKRVQGLQEIEETHQHALIVEDAISTRKSLAQFMRDLGFKVEVAIDGVDAVAKIQQQIPSIILTDLEMPRMNGLELTDHVRSNDSTQDIPIIMITSRATDKHKQEAMRMGVNEYMTKPYDEDQLLTLVNSLSNTV